MKMRFALLAAALLPFACTSEDPVKSGPDKTAKKMDDKAGKSTPAKGDTELTSMTTKFELGRVP